MIADWKPIIFLVKGSKPNIIWNFIQNMIESKPPDSKTTLNYLFLPSSLAVFNVNPKKNLFHILFTAIILFVIMSGL
jgi:hypothetical protein